MQTFFLTKHCFPSPQKGAAAAAPPAPPPSPTHAITVGCLLLETATRPHSPLPLHAAAARPLLLHAAVAEVARRAAAARAAGRAESRSRRLALMRAAVPLAVEAVPRPPAAAAGTGAARRAKDPWVRQLPRLMPLTTGATPKRAAAPCCPPPPPLQPQPGGGVFRGAVLVNGVSVPRAAPRSRSLPPSQRGASRPRSLPPALRRPEALPTPAAVRAAAACASMEAGRRRAKPRAVGLVRRGEGVRNEVGARGTSMERGRIAATASSSHDAMMANLAAWVGGLLSRSESNK